MIAAVAILLMMASAAINPFNFHEGVLSMAATVGNVCLAEDAKAEFCECAQAFTDLVSTEDPSRFYKAVTDLYRILSTYRSVELRDESIKDAIDQAFKSWGGVQGGKYVFDYKDIDYQYYSVIDLIGFDAWHKVELNEGELVKALVPGEIRHSSVKDAYPAIFEFEIYDTSTLWAEKCKVYARFCKLMSRRVCTEEEQAGGNGNNSESFDAVYKRVFPELDNFLTNEKHKIRKAVLSVIAEKKPTDDDSEIPWAASLEYFTKKYWSHSKELSTTKKPTTKELKTKWNSYRNWADEKNVAHLRHRILARYFDERKRA